MNSNIEGDSSCLFLLLQLMAVVIIKQSVKVPHADALDIGVKLNLILSVSGQ